MVLEYQNIQLLGKGVFERIKFKPPLKAAELMRNEACLIYAENGQSRMRGGYQNESLSTGDSVLMKCGNFINHWEPTQEEETYEAFAIHLYPVVIEFAFDKKLPDYLLTPPDQTSSLVFQKIPQSTVIQSYIAGLKIYFENPALFTEETIKLKLRELISLLYSLDSAGMRELVSNMFNETELEFKKVIEAHALGELKLEEFAIMLGMSLSTFKRKFKEVYDTSPKQHFINRKLQVAAEKLRSSDLRINEICYDCGFGDVSNFTKAFSKKYGVSPSAYREKK